MKLKGREKQEEKMKKTENNKAQKRNNIGSPCCDYCGFVNSCRSKH